MKPPIPIFMKSLWTVPELLCADSHAYRHGKADRYIFVTFLSNTPKQKRSTSFCHACDFRILILPRTLFWTSRRTVLQGFQVKTRRSCLWPSRLATVQRLTPGVQRVVWWTTIYYLFTCKELQALHRFVPSHTACTLLCVVCGVVLFQFCETFTE